MAIPVINVFRLIHLYWKFVCMAAITANTGEHQFTISLLQYLISHQCDVKQKYVHYMFYVVPS